MALRILAPADSVREASALIGAGAGALYFGFVPREWSLDRSPVESFNRRTFSEAQIDSWDEAAALLETARSAGVPASVTFNASYYPEEMYGPILECLRRLAGLGADGFIVSDIPLIIRLGEEGIGPLTLSTMGGVTNSGAVSFYRRLGVRRFNLPRALTTRQIEGITGAHPEISFDVFALFGACANIEAFCRWVHDDPGRVWPCVQDYTPLPPQGEGPSAAARAQIGWSGLSRAWACGLCSLYDLARLGNVQGLKVVGRGAPLERKLAGVRILKKLLETANEGAVSAGDYRRAAVEARRGAAGGECSPYLCYYPEYL
jgi:collagenase-like PrtC family protease